MKRSTFEGRTVVHAYGAPRRWAGQPVDLPDEAFRQLRLANDLRNRLVEAERAHEDTVAAIWATDPACAAAQQEVADCVAAEADMVERAKRERVKDRTTTPRDGTAAYLAAARTHLKTARKELQAARDAAYPALAPQFHAARKAVSALTGAGGEWSCANTDLHAGTWSDTVDRHKVAVAELGKRRAAGQWGRMQFHRFDGSGTLRAQLQRGAGDPPRTFELLSTGGGKWANVCTITRLAPHPDMVVNGKGGNGKDTLHGRDRMWTLSMTLGHGRGHIEVPFVMHRPLPAGADITDVRVTRRRVAGSHKLTVQFTCRLDAPAPKPAGHVAGVHVGWRSFGPKGVRVGVVRGTHLEPAPAHLTAAGVLTVADDGRTAEVFVPRPWVEVMARTAGTRATRDKALDTLRAQVVAALPVPELPVTAAEVARWRSPARFARLARDWPADHPLAARLEAWRVQDRHLWEWEAHERDQVAARRRGAWREVAAWLTACTSRLAVGAMHLPDLSEVPDVGCEDTRQARLARAQRQLAAPGELRHAVRQTATANGVAVDAVDSRRVSIVHAACGTLTADRDHMGDKASVWCEACGVAYDQDHNAAALLLARALAT